MAGFVDWIKDNAMVATIPVIAFACMVVDAEPVDFIIALAAIFSASFIIVSIVRLIDIAIYNMK